nr:ABC transporter permease [Longispora albida]
MPPEKDVAPRPNRPFRIFIEELTTASTFMVTVLAVVLALLVGSILVIISNDSAREAWGYFFAAPLDAFEMSWYAVRDAYVALFQGAIYDPAKPSAWGSISETLTYAAPLTFTGLSVALAFRAGLFNIGAQGQAVFGAIFGVLAGFLLHLPPVLHMLVALVCALIGGALWGFIPGILKAKTGAHEVITTIMLNNIAGIFLIWLVVQKGFQNPERTDAISKSAEENARLPRLLGFLEGDLRVNLAIVLAVLAAAGVSWLLNRSTFGFELRAVGGNPDAAKTAGMNVAMTYALVMAVAGGLAGLGGASMSLGLLPFALTPGVIANIGFDGITVALLGRAKPWGVLAGALLMGGLQAGAVKMNAVGGVPTDMVYVLQALIVIFIAAPALIKTVFRLRDGKASRSTATLAKGW